MHTHGEAKVKCLLSLSTLVFEARTLCIWGSLIQLGLLTSELHRPSCLSPTLFRCALQIQAQFLMHSKCSCPPNHLPRPHCFIFSCLLINRSPASLPVLPTRGNGLSPEGVQCLDLGHNVAKSISASSFSPWRLDLRHIPSVHLGIYYLCVCKLVTLCVCAKVWGSLPTAGTHGLVLHTYRC